MRFQFQFQDGGQQVLAAMANLEVGVVQSLFQGGLGRQPHLLQMLAGLFPFLVDITAQLADQLLGPSSAPWERGWRDWPGPGLPRAARARPACQSPRLVLHGCNLNRASGHRLQEPRTPQCESGGESHFVSSGALYPIRRLRKGKRIVRGDLLLSPGNPPGWGRIGHPSYVILFLEGAIIPPNPAGRFPVSSRSLQVGFATLSAWRPVPAWRAPRGWRQRLAFPPGLAGSASFDLLLETQARDPMATLRFPFWMVTQRRGLICKPVEPAGTPGYIAVFSSASGRLLTWSAEGRRYGRTGWSPGRGCKR